MSGPSGGAEFRALCKGNLPGIINNLQRMYSGADADVQELILRTHNLCLASMRTDNPNGLRAPLFALINLFSAHQESFIVDPAKFEVLLLARAYASSALKIVELLPAPGAQPARREQQPARREQQPARREQQPARREQQPEQQQVQPERRASLRLTELRARVKQEPQEPRDAVVPANRRRTLPARFSPSKTAHNDSNIEIIEKKKCEHCEEEVLDDEVELLRHAWEEHKEHVYKYLLPDQVCTVDYCDFVGAHKSSMKLHNWHCHDNNNRKHQAYLPKLEAGKCIYCDEEINSLVELKQHMVNDCKKRDERPMLGCSTCSKTFHFISDVIAHLRSAKAHGKPVLLVDN